MSETTMQSIGEDTCLFSGDAQIARIAQIVLNIMGQLQHMR